MSYDSVVAADSPLAWWKLAEGAGATSNLDSSGNGHTGTPSNIVFHTWTPVPSTPSETGPSFNGTSSRMSSAYNPSGQSAFSVELILNAQGNAQSYSRVVANDYTDGGDNKGFEVNLNGTTSLQVQFAIGNGTTFGFAGSFNTVPVTGTHVVTCTWDGTTLRIYIDGVLDPYTGSVSGTLAAGSYDVMIGADPGLGPGNYYVGELAQVSLYGTALSQADITAHYLAATAPAGHWIAPFSDANDFPFKGPLAFLRIGSP